MKPVVVRNVAIGEGIPKICVPIVGKTIDEILNQAKHICEIGADVVEWRVDWFEEVKNYESVENAAKQLRDILGETPILFTFRTAKEGGERTIELDEYVELNEKIAKSGYVDIVDVEAFTGDTYVEKVIKTAHECGVKVIASNHDFRKTLPKEELITRMRKMQELGADIPKIAVMPQSTEDLLALLSATEEMRRCYADRPVITMSMAGTGVLSRMCGEVFGSALTFGAAGKVSAPGQIDVEELRKVLGILHKSL